jgi:hypothetical protein
MDGTHLVVYAAAVPGRWLLSGVWRRVLSARDRVRVSDLWVCVELSEWDEYECVEFDLHTLWARVL